MPLAIPLLAPLLARRPAPCGERGAIPIVGEIRAWRAWRLAWRLSKDRLHLHSLFTETRWYPNVPMEGNVDRRQFGTKGQGVYAWNSEQRALAELSNLRKRDRFVSAILVNGQVDLYGEVVWHDRGYRAQFAEIVSIDYLIGVPGQRHSLIYRSPILDLLRHRYNVAP